MYKLRDVHSRLSPGTRIDIPTRGWLGNHLLCCLLVMFGAMESNTSSLQTYIKTLKGPAPLDRPLWSGRLIELLWPLGYLCQASTVCTRKDHSDLRAPYRVIAHRQWLAGRWRVTPIPFIW